MPAKLRWEAGNGLLTGWDEWALRFAAWSGFCGDEGKTFSLTPKSSRRALGELQTIAQKATAAIQMGGMIAVALLLKLYDGLALQEAVQPVDLIFVLAGRMERKRYGLDLYRQGVAPRLVLSIGRFEVSKMGTLGLDAFDRLKALRDQTPPGDRHFFLEMRGTGACIENTALPAWNTYGEVVGLRRLLERQSAGKVMVVSTDVHLRRVAMAIDRVFRDVPVRFRYCAVPFPISELQRENWWARREQRRFVLSEAIKLAGYRLVFFLPEPVMRRLMRMRRRGSRQK